MAKKKGKFREEVLDIGCGLNPHGTVNIDCLKLPTVDKVVDVNRGLPFKSGSFDEVIMCHTLEHFDDFFFVMGEVWRVLKKGGIARISVPYFRHACAYEPNHKAFFTSYSFDTFEPGHHYNYYSKARFKVLKRKFFFNHLGWLLNPLIEHFDFFKRFYEESLSSLVPAWQIYFELGAIKR